MTLESGGYHVCYATRVSPTVAVTAKHCVEQARPLTTGGKHVGMVIDTSRDIVGVRVPAGHYVESGKYIGGDVLVGSGQYPVLYHGAFWLETDAVCSWGDSGLPVFDASKRIVGVVTDSSGGHCFAELLK